MPRKKKVSENVESVVVSEVMENKQLEEVPVDNLNVTEKTEEIEKESAEKAGSKQRKPRVKKAVVKKEEDSKEVATKRSSVKMKKEDSQEKQIFIQYAEKEVTIATIEERVKKAWESEGHRASSIKKLDIYIKPAESAVYYVINGKNAGRVDF